MPAFHGVLPGQEGWGHSFARVGGQAAMLGAQWPIESCFLLFLSEPLPHVCFQVAEISAGVPS